MQLRRVMNVEMVSVLMTAYNREAYIAEAIESVLNSDYPFFELIIVDDRSCDNTVSIAERYAADDKRIRLYVNHRNIGDYPNRNKAASYAKGKFIMFCDSDDKFFTDSISYCVFSMKNNPSANIGFYHKTNDAEPLLINSSMVIEEHFFRKAILNIGPGGIIINREYFFQTSGFPEKYGPANDMYFNLKAASKSPVLLLPKLFLNYRIHDNQEKNNHFAYLHNGYNYLKDALTEIPLPLSREQKNWLSNKNKRRFLMNIMRYYLKTFDLKKSVLAIKKANYSFKDALSGIFHPKL